LKMNLLLFPNQILEAPFYAPFNVVSSGLPDNAAPV